MKGSEDERGVSEGERGVSLGQGVGGRCHMMIEGGHRMGGCAVGCGWVS